MDGELKKLRIESYTNPEYTGAPAATFEVLFNPNTYSVKYAVEYEEDQGRGTGLGPLATRARFLAIRPSAHRAFATTASSRPVPCAGARRR